MAVEKRVIASGPYYYDFIKNLYNLLLRFGLFLFIILPLPIPFYFSFYLFLRFPSHAPHSNLFVSIPSFIRHLISNSLIHDGFYLS